MVLGRCLYTLDDCNVLFLDHIIEEGLTILNAEDYYVDFHRQTSAKDHFLHMHSRLCFNSQSTSLDDTARILREQRSILAAYKRKGEVDCVTSVIRAARQ